MARNGDNAIRPRRQERPNAWFRLCIALIWPIAQLLTRRRRVGLENLPATGGALIVANHVSVVDPLTVAQLIYDGGRLPHFMAKDSLFRAPVLGRIMNGTQQIPVRRHSTEAVDSLSAAIEALKEGMVVVIYPEGTTTKDPELWPMRAHTGVARLALSSDVPVLPLAQWGTHEISSRGQRFRPFRRPVVQSTLGEPIDLSAWRGQNVTPAVLRQITDTIMFSITESLGTLREATPPNQPWHPGEVTVA